MKLAFIALLLPLVLLHTPPYLGSLCPSEATKLYVDISAAKIQKNRNFEYGLTLYDTPVTITYNQTEIVLHGNFSKLILKSHSLQKQFIYYGTQLVLKIPADHIFNLKKTPQLQIQIIHASSQITKDNPFHYIMLSQLYVVSKFTNKIETVLGKYFNIHTMSGNIVETEKVVKIIEGFPMLMYKGSAETYPCRSDLLCLVKREYQLISMDDFSNVKGFLNGREEAVTSTKTYKRKNIYQIQQIKKNQNQSEEIQLQL